MKSERFEALIDAILAIIVTIIVLEIRMASGGSWEALFELKLDFIIYALSFLVVFNFWNYNNNIFQIVNKINYKVIWLMGIALFILSFLPYLTIFVAENFYSFIPHALYGLTFLSTAILSILIALQVALSSNKPIYSTILMMGIGYIIGYLAYPPAVTICCLISIPVLWIIRKRQFM